MGATKVGPGSGPRARRADFTVQSDIANIISISDLNVNILNCYCYNGYISTLRHGDRLSGTAPSDRFAKAARAALKNSGAHLDAPPQG